MMDAHVQTYKYVYIYIYIYMYGPQHKHLGQWGSLGFQRSPSEGLLVALMIATGSCTGIALTTTPLPRRTKSEPYDCVSG